MYLFDTSGLALLVSMNLVSTTDKKMLAKATDCHFDAYLGTLFQQIERNSPEEQL